VEGEWHRTPKTHPMEYVLGALQEENSGVDAKHIKHVHYMFKGKGSTLLFPP